MVVKHERRFVVKRERIFVAKYETIFVNRERRFLVKCERIFVTICERIFVAKSERRFVVKSERRSVAESERRFVAENALHDCQCRHEDKPREYRITSKLNCMTVPVLPSLIYPFHLLPSSVVHPIGFSFCFFPDFLAIFIFLSSIIICIRKDITKLDAVHSAISFATPLSNLSECQAGRTSVVRIGTGTPHEDFFASNTLNLCLRQKLVTFGGEYFLLSF